MEGKLTNPKGQGFSKFSRSLQFIIGAAFLMCLVALLGFTCNSILISSNSKSSSASPAAAHSLKSIFGVDTLSGLRHIHIAPGPQVSAPHKSLKKEQSAAAAVTNSSDSLSGITGVSEDKA